MGVAKQLLSFFVNLGMSEEEAKERVWLVDTKVSVPIVSYLHTIFTNVSHESLVDIIVNCVGSSDRRSRGQVGSS